MNFHIRMSLSELSASLSREDRSILQPCCYQCIHSVKENLELSRGALDSKARPLHRSRCSAKAWFLRGRSQEGGRCKDGAPVSSCICRRPIRFGSKPTTGVTQANRTLKIRAASLSNAQELQRALCVSLLLSFFLSSMGISRHPQPSHIMSNTPLTGKTCQEPHRSKYRDQNKAVCSQNTSQRAPVSAP
jgi:hypothetical protein